MKETQAKQVKNPNTILHFIAIMLIAITMISSSFGLYAWARYISGTQGNATAQVAKWYFNLKTGEYTQNGPQLLALTRTDGREHVAEGKLAPGTYGVLPIIVDTTGTETDLTYDVTITINNCPKNMLFTPQTPASTTQTVTGDGTAQNPRVRTIRIQKYIPYAQTGELDETISWNWPYETTSGNGVAENDGIDTADSGKEVTVTITAVGTEVLSRPISMATITDNNSNTINSGDIVDVYAGGTTKLNIENGTEGVTFSSNDTEVATVAADGTITGVSAGDATITITGNQSGKTTSVNINVIPAITVKVNGVDTTLTPQNTGSYYGSVVTNYKTGTNNDESYQLFFIDYEGKYGNKGDIYLRKMDVVSRSEGLPVNSYDINSTDLKIKQMNKLWAAAENQVINTNGEKAVAWLCDTTVWGDYATGDSKARYAIGGPSIEMYLDSYNEAVDADNKGSKMSYTLPNANGYYWSGSRSNVGKNSMYTTKTYWLASPYYNDPSLVISAYADYVNGYSYNITFGVAPLVCLESDFSLQLE